MELIDQIHALEGEIKLVKGEIKKVLVDLREAMNTAENPFAYLEQFQQTGGNIVDDERLKHLEENVGQLGQTDERLKHLEESVGQLGQTDERLRHFEETAEQLKELGGGKGSDEERIKNLEDTVEELAEIVSGIFEEKVKHLENTVQELKEQRDAEIANLKHVEPAIEMVAGPENQSESMLVRRPRSESDLNEFGILVRDEYGNEVINAITLAQLIQWADTTVNLIGMEKLNQVVDLLELTGRISKETKDTIFKIAKLPDVVQIPDKEHVEARHCIVALFELNRILTGRHQELSMLLKDSMLRTINAK